MRRYSEAVNAVSSGLRNAGPSYEGSELDLDRFDQPASTEIRLKTPHSLLHQSIPLHQSRTSIGSGVIRSLLNMLALKELFHLRFSVLSLPLCALSTQAGHLDELRQH